MTNEKAIEVIKANWPEPRYRLLQEALTLAINLLKTGAKCV